LLLKKSEFSLKKKFYHSSNYCSSNEKTLEARSTDGAAMQGDIDILSS